MNPGWCPRDRSEALLLTAIVPLFTGNVPARAVDETTPEAGVTVACVTTGTAGSGKDASEYGDGEDGDVKVVGT